MTFARAWILFAAFATFSCVSNTTRRPKADVEPQDPGKKSLCSVQYRLLLSDPQDFFRRFLETPGIARSASYGLLLFEFEGIPIERANEFFALLADFDRAHAKELNELYFDPVRAVRAFDGGEDENPDIVFLSRSEEQLSAWQQKIANDFYPLLADKGFNGIGVAQQKYLEATFVPAVVVDAKKVGKDERNVDSTLTMLNESIKKNKKKYTLTAGDLVCH